MFRYFVEEGEKKKKDKHAIITPYKVSDNEKKLHIPHHDYPRLDDFRYRAKLLSSPA